MLRLGKIGERLGKGLGGRVDRMEEGHLLVQKLFLKERREYNSSNPGFLQTFDRVETVRERGGAATNGLGSDSPRYVVERSIYHTSFPG